MTGSRLTSRAGFYFLSRPFPRFASNRAYGFVHFTSRRLLLTTAKNPLTLFFWGGKIHCIPTQRCPTCNSGLGIEYSFSD